MSIRTLIVDDEALARERVRSLLGAHPAIEIVGECRDGMAAVLSIESLAPDLVVLDIQMPHMTGFEVLESIERSPLPAVVFVTAYDEYALAAFDAHAVDYVLKPIVPDRFAQAIERVLSRIHPGLAGGAETDNATRARLPWSACHGTPRTRFVVRRGGAVSFIAVDEVDWIDAAANYIQLHASGRTHLVRSTMNVAETELDPAAFLRVHRSHIVNVHRITRVVPHSHGEYEVTMRDGAMIIASRTYSARLRALLR